MFSDSLVKLLIYLILFVTACNLLGDWYAQYKMMKEAIGQYKYACEKFKYPRSCYKYGVSLLDGSDVGCETDINKVRFDIVGEI